MEYRVKALRDFFDEDSRKDRVVDDEWLVSKERAIFLQEHNATKIIEEKKEIKPIIKSTLKREK